MAGDLSRFKPGINRRTHLFLSATFWSLIGTVMVVRGILCLLKIPEHQLLLIGVSFAVGSAKSLIILDKTARNGIERILEFKDGTCMGAVYSVKTWGLVLAMMAMGVLLRKLSLPVTLLSFVYFTIGWGLIFSSRLGWVAWLETK